MNSKPFKPSEVCIRCKDGSELEALHCDDQRCPEWKHKLQEVQE